MGEERGTIGFFSTYRPPVPFDIYSSPISPSSKSDEIRMTDGISYNYNGQVIPPPALKLMLKRPKLASEATAADVDSGRVMGMLMVSEQTHNLETLHIVLCFNGGPNKVKVFSFAEVYGTFAGVRMEDSGCIAGNYLVYVSTMDRPEYPNDRRQPWTAVFKTHLGTGKTERLTQKNEADLSPAVSPNGKRIAVASFVNKGWNGETEDLQTDIYVMNVDRPLGRKLVVRNGGWPSWGSDDVLFFHRKVGGNWGVFRADVSKGRTTDTPRVTPDGIDAVTPAAIDANTVVVATIRQKSSFNDVRAEAQYRHIEIFDSSGVVEPGQITQKTGPKADHYNPFVFVDMDGVKRVGYHRANTDLLKTNKDDIPRQSNKILSPQNDVGLLRVSGAFPTFSKDGSKLAFVDNEFRVVWLADSKGLRIVYETEGPDNVFSPTFGQNPDLDVLYICMGPSFHADDKVEIFAIFDVSKNRQQAEQLTKGGHNNAFPSSNPQGTKLVFRSTRDGGPKKYKNLYIMEDADVGEYAGGKITRLTQGEWIDSHCEWSPKGDWIVFSSTRDKPTGALDSELDPGYYAVFLIKADDPTTVVRVLGSETSLPRDNINFLAGYVSHPFFSPDGKSIVVASDLAAISVDPISMPLFLHAVRPYGDVFTVDIDPDDISKNKDLTNFNRITHSRYENGTASWSMVSTDDPSATWDFKMDRPYTPACPYAYADGGESWQMTGHL